MAHPLVDQIRFTRSDWLRGLERVTEEEGTRHFGQMNCISWIVGHMAWHEQRTFLLRPQGIMLFPKINQEFANGAPMTSPSLAEMLDRWRIITKATDPFLDTMTTESLQTELLLEGKSIDQSLGSALRRITYHYWFHVGEVQAIRQMLGHKNLPEYVGPMEDTAPYRPE